MENNELVLFMPLKLKKRGGRQMVLVPENSGQSDDSHVDDTLLKALVKAALWQQAIQTGTYHSIRDLCEQKKMSRKYVLSILQLNFLSPKIKSAIINGTQPRELRLINVTRTSVPLLWCEQAEKFGFDAQKN